LDISKVTIAQIFEKPRRYLVPLFQRRYVWSQAEQWQPLWDDIVAQAEALTRSRRAGNGPLRQHFMGAVVLGRETTGIREVPSSLLVDGQQRLTTMSVLLAALRDAGRALGDDFMAQSLQRLLANPEPLQERDEAYKVWPTQGDRVAFEDALNAGSRDALEARYPLPKRMPRKGDQFRPPIVEAYLFFAQVISDYLNDPEQAQVVASASAPREVLERRAADLLDAVTRHLQIVAIELDEEEDPQVIFETLNARGVPLLPSDLIRNFLFLTAQRQDSDVEQLYDKFWAPFDADWSVPGEKRPFWQEMIKQGRLKRPRIDLFLFHFTTLSIQQEIRIDHLFSEFRTWWQQSASDLMLEQAATRLSSGERSIAAELARLARFANHFRVIQLADPDTRLGRFGRRLKAVDTSTVFPLVLTLQDRSKNLGKEDFDASLRDLESYLVRRMVCALTTKGYNQIFLDLLRHLTRQGDFRNSSIREWLSGLTAVSDFWPDDEAFRRAWLEEPLYARLKPAKTCMLLEALEQASRSDWQETQSVPDGLTVEHMLPQNPQPGDYPFAADDGAPMSALVERRARLVHSMGNLTLLTMALNKSVSNGPWSVKRPVISKQSLLLLNRHCDRPDVMEGWNEDGIRRRGDQLFNIATQVWPGPTRNLSVAIPSTAGSFANGS
jgi:uncharacterized protein with ParB-like and HNH nuclease domain